MEKHIDVIGYLLVVIVFSVGFLMARHQDYWQERLTTASDASWQLRDALARGDRVSPQDIAPVLLVNSPDAVAMVARIVNFVLVLCAMTVAFDAFRLKAHPDVDRPADAEVLITALTIATIAVMFLSEYHVIRTTRKSAAAIHATGVGKLQELSRVLGHVPAERTEEICQDLRAAYPTWTLLDEASALGLLTSGGAPQALLACQRLAEETPERLTLAPAIAVAAALEAGFPQSALPVLDAVRRVHGIRQFAGLRRGAGLAACELDHLINPPQEGDRVRTQGSSAMRLGAYGGLVPSQQLPILLDPLRLDACRGVLSAVEAWDGGDRQAPVSIEGYRSEFEDVQRAVLDGDPDGSDLDGLRARALQDSSVPLCETVAVLLLARGRGADAIELLTRAIEMRPAEHRTQWLLGLCYRESGWEEFAVESFRNALQLAPPDHPLNTLTMRLARLAQPSRDEAQTTSLYWAGHGQYDELRLLAALAGEEHLSLGDPSSPRSAFVERLVEISLSNRASADSTLG